MKKEGRWKALFLVLAAGLLTTGCGAGAKGVSADTAVPQEACEIASEEAYDNAASVASGEIYTNGAEAKMQESGGADAGGGGREAYSAQRKLIKNVNLQVETENFDELLVNVEEKTRKAGGYIEQSYTYNGSSYYGGGTRNASLTIRIPAEQLDAFLSAVSEVSNVITQNESVTDVTLQYVDLESHKKALLAEQERLLELLDAAETIEDIISLESRLSEVRYQIESMESQLRTMDNQVSYSTIELYINEVEKLTPVKEQTVWQKISVGFSNSLHNVGNGLLNFGIGLIISLPYLMLWAVIILIIVLICVIIIKTIRKKAQKKEKEQTPEQKKGK